MSSEISFCTEADLPALVPLFEAYRSFYGKAPSARAERFLRERITSGQSMVLLVRDGVDYVGFTQIYRGFSSIDLTQDWILNDLYVDGSARGKRYGSALVDTVISLAREAGADRVTLETQVSNAHARRLYESRGFTVKSQDGEQLTYAKELTD